MRPEVCALGPPRRGVCQIRARVRGDAGVSGIFDEAKLDPAGAGARCVRAPQHPILRVFAAASRKKKTELLSPCAGVLAATAKSSGSLSEAPSMLSGGELRCKLLSEARNLAVGRPGRGFKAGFRKRAALLPAPKKRPCSFFLLADPTETRVGVH